MARRLIGLDIGTNAVTIAEVTAGTPPRLDMFAQVALPRDAMREGEVADVAAVTDAVARLRNEVGLKKVPVRIGIASPRVVVRQVEMPVMTRDELMSALQFQAGDLIPIPIEEAVLDFAILGTSQSTGESNEPTMQVLLVAAYESAITKLVSAIEAGGLDVGAVDLIPLALTRALARPIPAMATVGADGMPMAGGSIGAEGIVSFGGGVTAISVHENGVPQFVRVLGTGGRELTDAIATDLGVPPETAEALKRALANPQPDEMVARARTAVDRPLSALLDDVRSSIDYYRNQSGSAQLRRVVVTGGSAQLPGLPERLAALVGVPVEPAYMHDLLRIGDIGFAPDELPRLEPYLPAPVGLALGGANVGTVIDLRPRSRGKAAKAAGGGVDRRFVAAGLAGLVLLGGLTYMGHSAESKAQKKSVAAQEEAKKLREQLYNLQQGPAQATSVATLKAEVTNVLGQDVDWPAVLGNIGPRLPLGVRLESFAGTRTVDQVTTAAPAPVTPAAGSSDATGTSSSTGTSATAATAPATPTVTSLCAAANDPNGTITITGTAPTVPAVAALIDTLNKDTDLTVVWVKTAAAHLGAGGRVDVQFSLGANLGHTARGHRLESFFKEQKCK
jgi:type IV pilus assembly protein PilM